MVFSLPVVGPLLHRAKQTGYDRAGMLVPSLSNVLLRKKIVADAARQEVEMKQRLKLAREERMQAEADRAAGTDADPQAAEKRRDEAADIIQQRARAKAFRKQLLADGVYWSGGARRGGNPMARCGGYPMPSSTAMGRGLQCAVLDGISCGAVKSCLTKPPQAMIAT